MAFGFFLHALPLRILVKLTDGLLNRVETFAGKHADELVVAVGGLVFRHPPAEAVQAVPFVGWHSMVAPAVTEGVEVASRLSLGE